MVSIAVLCVWPRRRRRRRRRRRSYFPPFFAFLSMVWKNVKLQDDMF